MDKYKYIILFLSIVLCVTVQLNAMNNNNNNNNKRILNNNNNNNTEQHNSDKKQRIDSNSSINNEFLKAVIENNITKAESLLEFNFDVTIQNNNYDDILITLLDLETQITIDTKYLYRSDSALSIGDTALIIAVRNNNLKMVELLLNHGAKIDAENYHGEYPLLLAAENGDYNMVVCLVNYYHKLGKKIDFNKNYFSCLWYALQNNNLNIAEYLITQGCDVNDYNSDNSSTGTVLECCIKHDLEKSIEFLLKYNVTLDNTDSNEHYNNLNGFLTYAAYHNSIKTIELLINKGANINSKDKDKEDKTTFGKTSLHIIVDNYVDKILYNIKKLKQKIDEKIKQQVNELNIIYLLINRGTDINLQTDETNNTALNLLSKSNPDDMSEVDIKLIEFFIINGADPTIPNNEHKTPLHNQTINLIYEKYKKLMYDKYKENFNPILLQSTNLPTVLIAIILEYDSTLNQKPYDVQRILCKHDVYNYIQQILEEHYEKMENAFPKTKNPSDRIKLLNVSIGTSKAQKRILTIPDIITSYI